MGNHKNIQIKSIKGEVKKIKKLLAMGLALVLPLALAVPAMAQGQVEPSEVEIQTYPGAVIEIDKLVTTSPIPPNPDIYFRADTTQSMNPVLAAVQANANAILAAIVAAEPTAQFGVGNYKDFPSDPYCFNHQLSITDDTSAVATAIGAWSAIGGYDLPEGQFYALDRLADGTGIGWRSGPNKIVIWFGDAPAHDPVPMAATGLGYDITETTVTTALVGVGIKVIAISNDTGFYPAGINDDPNVGGGDYNIAYGTIEHGAPGQASNIAGATGGGYYFAATPAEAAAAVLAGIEALKTDVWGEVGTTPPGITVELDPPVHYDVLGDETVQFTETITVDPSVEPGEYSITVTFYENTYGEEGEGIGTQDITIEILPLVEVEKHWSYTNVCFMQDNDGDGLYDEDPYIDGNDEDMDGQDGEDPIECDGEYSLGTELTQLEATVKNGIIKKINPGQFYAVSTVTVLEDLDQLVITENYSDVISSGIGELNPRKGGGKVVVVKMDG